MEPSDGQAAGPHLLEEHRPFSESFLWDLQRHYFMERGVDAWRVGEVPQYITSNPTVANAYAEVVFALWRDQQRLAPGAAPLHLCELGAGSGRLAFHLLKRLARLCELSGVPLGSFRYVLTDVAQSNLDFWRGHPLFAPFFAAGLLDVALFDVTAPSSLSLQVSGQTLGAGDLERPLVLIANYLFDSIPQDLFYIDGGQSQRCLVALLADTDPGALSTGELLGQLRGDYRREPLDGPPYPEPYLRQILAEYERQLSGSYLLFPAAALRCLDQLSRWSPRGLLLLSTDKGEHRLAALQRRSPPSLVRHGSFSLSVNYHAISWLCEQRGGLALFPSHPHHSVSVSCCMMLDRAAEHHETRLAYARYVQDFSPDDFFTMAKQMQQCVGDLDITSILAFLRFSLYDSHQFAHTLRRLLELAPELGPDDRAALSDAIGRVWELYFPLGEPLDLAYYSGMIFYAMEDYARALPLFERSIADYGYDIGTLYNTAVCHRALGHHQKAKRYLQLIIQHDPHNPEAAALLAEYRAAG